MKITLIQSGDPPDDGRDIGVVHSPATVNTLPGSEYAGEMGHFGSFGQSIPLWARVRYVLRIKREEQKPFKCLIPGVGELYVGEEGWRLYK